MLLLVDHDPNFLEKAEGVLDPGHGIFFAGTAAHAMELLQSVGAAFTVAMIDLNLPGQDGFELIREIHQAFPDLPLIAISGTFHDAALQSARMLGATDALHKPIGPEWNAALARARGHSHQR